ncbi:hypothetical protein QVA66_09400 [Staphylococcus chromogenes]|nr:hypothetical protein [Staphylococcus chromogenes]
MLDGMNCARRFFYALTALVISFGWMIQQDVSALENTSAVIEGKDEIDIAVETYVDPVSLLFDVEQAVKNGEKAEITEFGNDYNEAVVYAQNNCFAGGLKNPGDPNSEVIVRPYGVDPAGWPIAERWNWCGRDRTNGGEPQNSADAVCRDHDWCLGAGTSVCECDRRFIDGLNAIKHNYSWGDRAYIEAAIQLVPLSHGC